MERFQILITYEGFAVFDGESRRIYAGFDTFRAAWDFVQSCKLDLGSPLAA